MIFRADGWWERAKKRSQRFAAADSHADQTHTHHAFVTVLIGGGIAVAILTCLQYTLGSFGWELAWTWQGKLGTGCLVANLCYVVREVEARCVMGWRYALWDGWHDVFVPACFWVPAWYGSLPLLYGMLAVYCLGFFLLRPVA